MIITLNYRLKTTEKGNHLESVHRPTPRTHKSKHDPQLPIRLRHRHIRVVSHREEDNLLVE